MTAAFLGFSKSCGNDLSTPIPEFGFAGLKPVALVMAEAPDYRKDNVDKRSARPVEAGRAHLWISRAGPV